LANVSFRTFFSLGLVMSSFENASLWGDALTLSTIGVYGVIAYSVHQRQTEFGIRIALGAQRHEIVKLAIAGGMRLVLAGIAIGLVVGFIAMRGITTLLFGVGANDPVAFSAIIALLLAVAFVAAYIPARRATASDPLSALRID
jgi:putative ABC transport system permease protein